MKIFALACQRIDTCPRTYKHTPQSYSSVHAATRTGRNIRSIINERQRAGERKYVRERVQTVCMCIYIYARRFVDVAAADSLCKSSLLARALVSHIRASRPRNALVFKTLARVCGIDPEIYTRAFSMKCPAISARSFFNDSRTLYRAICVCALLPGIMRRVRSPGAKYASGASRAFFQRGDRFFVVSSAVLEGGKRERERWCNGTRPVRELPRADYFFSRPRSVLCAGVSIVFHFSISPGRVEGGNVDASVILANGDCVCDIG